MFDKLKSLISGAVIGLTLLFVHSRPANGQAITSPQDDKVKGRGPVDVLSDTGGSDVHSYLATILPMIQLHWYGRIPERAKMTPGKVRVAFRIARDGKISDVRYLLMSGDHDLDEAAFRGVVDSNPLPALASDYRCDGLTLAIRFYYNMRIDPAEHNTPGKMIPCVKSKITLVGSVGLAISPANANVETGAAQKFLATVTGLEGATVNWALTDPDCAGGACGNISPEGLYTAPSRLPGHAQVTVQATVASEPDVAATANVTVVEQSKKQ